MIKKNVLLFSLLLVSVFVFSGCWPNKSDDSAMEAEDVVAKIITMAEVEEHSLATDCWMVIEGRVYDFTKYIDGGIHPGGDSIVQRCGQDGTDLWLDIPGDKEEHSDYAASLLDNFYLGDLSN